MMRRLRCWLTGHNWVAEDPANFFTFEAWMQMRLVVCSRCGADRPGS